MWSHPFVKLLHLPISLTGHTVWNSSGTVQKMSKSSKSSSNRLVLVVWSRLSQFMIPKDPYSIYRGCISLLFFILFYRWKKWMKWFLQVYWLAHSGARFRWPQYRYFDAIGGKMQQNTQPIRRRLAKKICQYHNPLLYWTEFMLSISIRFYHWLKIHPAKTNRRFSLAVAILRYPPIGAWLVARLSIVAPWRDVTRPVIGPPEIPRDTSSFSWSCCRCWGKWLRVHQTTYNS